MERVTKICAQHLIKHLSVENCIEIRSLPGIARNKEFIQQVDVFIAKEVFIFRNTQLNSFNSSIYVFSSPKSAKSTIYWISSVPALKSSTSPRRNVPTWTRARYVDWYWNGSRGRWLKKPWVQISCSKRLSCCTWPLTTPCRIASSYPLVSLLNDNPRPILIVDSIQAM